MTETVKHTPGAWRVEQGTTIVWGNCNPDGHSTRGMGYPIADARINPSGNWSTGPYADEGEANARLIAASPTMKDALAGLLDLFGGYNCPEVDAAIAVMQEIGEDRWSMQARMDAINAEGRT